MGLEKEKKIGFKLDLNLLHFKPGMVVSYNWYVKVICLKRAKIQFLKVAKFYRRLYGWGHEQKLSSWDFKIVRRFFCSSGLPYLHLSITANTLQDSDGQGIEFIINHALVNFLDGNWKDVSVIHLFVA